MAVIKYLPEEIIDKTTNYLKIDKPKIIERKSLTNLRREYLNKAHKVLENKYGKNWARELTIRRDYKGIRLDDFPDYLFVYLQEDYRKRLFKVAYNVAGNLNKLATTLRVSPSRLSCWYEGKQKDYTKKVIATQFTPLSKLKLISELLVKDNNHEFSMLNIENNVIAYRMRAGNTIKNPKFPIQESPEMIRILFHLLGDGYSGNKKNNANYKNTCPLLLEGFKKDLKIFGEVPIYEQQDSIKFPRLFAELIENFYNVNTMTFESKISNEILKLPKKLLYQGIKAFADDEGTIYQSSIRLCSANYNLLNGISKIIDLIKLKRGEIKKQHNERATYGVTYYLDIKDIEAYHKHVGFSHPVKKKKLELFVKKKKSKLRRKELKS
ncbi:MAG: hypothetical protein Q8R00_03280 [Candidatus Nanoarchaeia archaeon]|nr:hypothetical protein [Candidatus Nanoarchaeia archaeon]